MGYLKQIDAILFFFQDLACNGGSFDRHNIWEFASSNKHFDGLDYVHLTNILDRLVEDGFLKRDTSIQDAYHISFKGLLFEGYENERTLTTRQNKLLEQQATRTSEISELNVKLAIRSYRLTVILAIGTSIAAIYYSIEIAKYLGWICLNPK